MTQQLIAVDVTALDALVKKVDRLEQLLHGGKFQPKQDWVSIQEAALILECCPSTIRRKINLGEIQAKGSGKSRRVRLD
jgi:hypothetical protein